MKFNGADDNIKAIDSAEAVASASKTAAHFTKDRQHPLVTKRLNSPEYVGLATVRAVGFSSSKKPKDLETTFRFSQPSILDPGIY